jgi:uncharacterized protein (TIGR02145 family)
MSSRTKPCPYCESKISISAKKCKFCGEWLEENTSHSGTSLINLETNTREVLKEKYDFQEVIGKGGMATVYKAIQKNLNRTVALKIIHQNLIHDTEFVSRFIREAQVSASLNHTNIVTVYDVGSIGSVHYIAMEFLEGEDLHQMVKHKGALEYSKLINWIIPIAEALFYIHEKGLIHRDIKSSNIIITKEGRPVLMDFGITQATNGTKLTQPGTVIGTPEYMSPEQAQCLPIDHRSDLYSLGVVMYECLTGKVPFKGDNPLTTINLLINIKPEKPNKLIINLNQELYNIIFQLLEKKPENRIADGKLLAISLKKNINKCLEKKPNNLALERRTIGAKKIINRNSLGNKNKSVSISKVFIITLILTFSSFIFLYYFKDNNKKTNSINTSCTIVDNNLENEKDSVLNTKSNLKDSIIQHEKLPNLENLQKVTNSNTELNTSSNLPKNHNISITETKAEIKSEKNESQLINTNIPKYEEKNKLAISSIDSIAEKTNKVDFSLAPIVQGEFKDPRDQRFYKWVKIGDQTWMAENLAYIPKVYNSKDNSLDEPYYYIYNFEKRNVELGKASKMFIKYGVLYNYEAAKIACPDEWHLPSDDEWEKLMEFISIENGKLSKNKNDWNFLGHILKDKNTWSILKIEKELSRDNYNFNVLPGGCRFNNNIFQDEEKIAYFWSSTPSNSYNSFARYVHFKSHVLFRKRFSKDFGLSVRCIKD